MRHPVAVLLPCLGLLLLAGSPLAQIHLAEADVTLLPPGDDARQGTELLTERFGQGNAIDVVLDFPGLPLQRRQRGHRLRARPEAEHRSPGSAR